MSARTRKPTSSTVPPVLAAAPSRRPMSLAFIGLVAVTVLMPMLASTLQIGGTGGFPGTQALLWMGALILLTFAAAVLDAVRCRRLVLPATWTVLGALLVAAGAGVAAWRASDRYAAVLGAVEAALGALYFLTCLMVADDRERIRWLLGALVAGTLVTAAAAVLGEVTLHGALLDYFMEYRLDILAENGIRPDSPDEQMFRNRMAGDVFGTFYHPNLMADYLAMGGLAALALLVGHARRLTERQADGQPKSVAIAATVVLSVVLAAAGAAIWMSRSRAGAASLVAGAYVMAVLATVRRRALRIVLVVAPAIVAAAVLGVVWQRGLAPEAVKSLQFRLDYWQGAWGVIRDHPLTGVGAGNFGSHYLAHKLPHAPEEIRDPHNLFVRAWAEFGPLGLAGVVILAAATLRECLRRGRTFAEPRWPMPVLWRPMIRAGVLVVLVGLVFRFRSVSDGGLAYVLLETLVTFLLMTAAFVGAIGAGLEDAPSLADRSHRWLRAGVLGALAAFLLQGQVSFSFSELPTAATAYLLVALAVATADGSRRIIVSLESPVRRAVAVIAVLAIVVLYGGALLVPVSRSLDELAAARDKAREVFPGGFNVQAFPDYRDTLHRAAQAAPAWLRWTEPDVRAAEGYWRAATALHEHAAFLRSKAAAAEEPGLRDRLQADADRTQEAARAAIGQVLAIYADVLAVDPTDVPTWHMLAMACRSAADIAPDVDIRDEALAAWRQVVTRYPTRAQFRVDYAECLGRYGETTEAARQARCALDLDDLMPDPLRKLTDDQRALCLKLLESSAP